ncbi:hypothetical protein EDB86DRAFT_2833736 [Lactarius hatsudake]|nr:hypothetical protein EDB86DRAFT_2833736 [Lactarius hatsudake]
MSAGSGTPEGAVSAARFSERIRANWRRAHALPLRCPVGFFFFHKDYLDLDVTAREGETELERVLCWRDALTRHLAPRPPHPRIHGGSYPRARSGNGAIAGKLEYGVGRESWNRNHSKGRHDGWGQEQDRRFQSDDGYWWRWDWRDESSPRASVVTVPLAVDLIGLDWTYPLKLEASCFMQHAIIKCLLSLNSNQLMLARTRATGACGYSLLRLQWPEVCSISTPTAICSVLGAASILIERAVTGLDDKYNRRKRRLGQPHYVFS